MKHVKLALVAFGAMALTAFVGEGTASATVLCSTTNDPCPAAQVWGPHLLEFSRKVGGPSFVLAATGGETLDTCSETVIFAAPESSGSATTTPEGPFSGFTMTGCTFPTTTLKSGRFKLHKTAGTSNLLIKGFGQELTINTIFFGSCIYGSSGEATLGTLSEGKPAIFTMNGLLVKLSGSNFACPETAKASGTYTLTSPSNTTLSGSSS
jgi:hypothetical protein